MKVQCLGATLALAMASCIEPDTNAPVSSGDPAPPAPPAASTTHVNRCSPPYWVDSAGHKRYRVECLNP